MSRKTEPKASLTLSGDETEIRSTATGKLIFTAYHGKPCAALLVNSRLTMLNFPESSKVGAIYLCRVKNVVPNIQACFVEIANGELCFLPMKDAKQVLLLNRKPDGRILEGDEFPVQIVRDVQKTKQASVTAHISFSDDFFAFSFGEPTLGISSKLEKAQKQALTGQLIEAGIIADGCFVQGLIADRFPGTSIPSVGLVVRTRAAEFCSDLTYERLKEQFTSILERFISFLGSCLHRTGRVCVLEPESMADRILPQLVSPDEFSEMITDDPSVYAELKKYAAVHLPSTTCRLYDDPMLSLSKLYNLDSRIDEAFNERVWLKSGAYLIIQPTEALTVIDVNSGKYEKRKGNDDQTAWKVNTEAAIEIARQLRLRNLSGIIVVDFINMRAEESRAGLLRQMKELVKNDKIRTTVVDMTPLGLVEITRKKIMKPLWEQFNEIHSI